MAAKVVMLAVPTVMGIASIRVYTVSEAPSDGLVTREKLNIYTPLPTSAQTLFVPESPGVIQNGLTSAREGIQPFVQAVKGACISVKTTSVNLYHKGEDAYYYLKDPPPEFLPRFGTITMAGVLGMFLARKGSQLKKVAVPLGLMTAGASVCYPAQTVAVFKITGKKVYSAGRWTSASVSSLFASQPTSEPVAKEIAVSQPQTPTVPSPESAAHSALIPETEVESVESVPLSDEPAASVISEEASSLTITEISPDQTPTETNTDPVGHSVAAETEVTTTSEEIPAPFESEETKQAAKEVSTDVASPAEPTPSLEPTLEAAPVEVAEVEAAPVEATLVQEALEEAAPVEVSPVEAAPVEVSPVEAAPVEAAIEEATPVEEAPVEAALEEAVPVEVVPVEAVPVEAVPVEAVPVEAAPVEAAPVEAAPVEAAPVEAVAAESVPSPEEPPAPIPLDDPAVLVIESAELKLAAEPELANATEDAAVEETLTPPPLPQQPEAEISKGGPSFKPDPSLLDFGQSSSEDEDLYTTRS
ncbi:MICOS complex subunit MIC27 isoform X2 [Eleginops maclovinus]|uniref:MICOS complex subunit MIC27 isoform X1 n=1 Tax=Eleginops maclovinus TaxID=56733 RepID=UPI003080D856